MKKNGCFEACGIFHELLDDRKYDFCTEIILNVNNSSKIQFQHKLESFLWEVRPECQDGFYEEE